MSGERSGAAAGSGSRASNAAAAAAGAAAGEADAKRVERAEKFKAKGNELFKAGRYPEAIKQYTEAIRAHPEHPVYYSNRAMAYLKAFMCVGGWLVTAARWCGIGHGMGCPGGNRRGQTRAALQEGAAAVVMGMAACITHCRAVASIWLHVRPTCPAQAVAMVSSFFATSWAHVVGTVAAGLWQSNGCPLLLF